MLLINIQTAINKRTPLIQWAVWFYLGNTLLFYFIGFRYLNWIIPSHFTAPTLLARNIDWLYILTAFLGHFTLLAFLPGIILLTPLMTFFPNRKLATTIAIMSSTVAAAILLIDVSVFTQYHFHLNGIVLKLALGGAGNEIFDFSRTEKLIAASVFCGIISIEIILAVGFWKVSAWLNKKINGFKIICGLIGCLVASYMMLMLSGIQLEFKPISQQPQAFPLYLEMLAKFLPGKQVLKELESIGAGQINQPEHNSALLHYPLHLLQCQPSKHPLNVLIIAIDSWRFDSLTPAITPNISQFAKKTWQFTHHFSGGNATQPGIFSLFYALPGTYWTAMLKQHQGPLFIQELLQQHYQTGIFASATLTIPEFNKTIFRDVAELQTWTPGKTAQDRDIQITSEFKQFLEIASKKQNPFFGFLFYDAAHSFCEVSNSQKPFSPAITDCNRFGLDKESDPEPYLNRYKNALFFIDNQIHEVLMELEKKKLLDHTVIILTGDHGNEFNDNKLGYWGHTSNFTHYQTQTPLLIYWPGEKPRIFTHTTSHYDIVPTLMTRLEHCRNPMDDYSVGKNLTSTSIKINYLISNSYIDFGVIEKDQITTVFPTGNYEISDLQGRPLSDASLHISMMQKVMADMQRFFSTTDKTNR